MTEPVGEGLAARLSAQLSAPWDVAALAVFRISFGLLMFGGIVRYLSCGWLVHQYVEPTFFFKYQGFGWVTAWPEWGMWLHFGVLAVLALFVALGLFYRVSIVLFGIGFAYVQLIDVTNYLNHYYLVVLLCGLMSLMPLHRAWSLDALRRPELRVEALPAWMTWLLRFQVGVVYVHAGLAKAGSDWLLHAQPLNLWMTARVETPIIGPWLDRLWVAYAMSWAGFLYDSSIVFLLLWSRTRPLAYALVLVFHFFTHVFFDIGMFPFIMVVATQIFFSPSWPRRLAARLRGLARRAREVKPAPNTPVDPAPRASAPLRAPAPVWRLRPIAAGLLVAYCAFQALFPLRHFLYPSDVLWGEEGMRWSWKVMLRAKHGSVTFHVTQKATGRTWQVSPHDYLLWRQAHEMAGQPDLILQLAHHIAEDFQGRGFGAVEVRAETAVSLNGRRPAPLVDPTVDLAQVEDRWAPAAWLTPRPETPPIQLRPAVAEAAR